MEIQAYTLPGCPSCSHLKELFRRANVEYEEILVGTTQMSVSDFNVLYPNISSFPFVVIDGEPIGGLIDVARLFVEKGLVSSKKE